MDQKENIICTMDDERGDILGPPNVTTSAAVIAKKKKKKKKKKKSLRAVSIIMRKVMGHTAVSAT